MSTRDERARRIAYFSMEIALADDIPTYSGGLGVLAGDTLKSAAELNVPIVAVILLHRYGYFRQRLTAQGHQEEQPQQWAPESNLEPLTASVEMRIEQRPVTIQAWRYWVGGATGTAVPVILLDTSVAMDAEWDRTLTDHLYGGDQRYRLCQEAVLGLGGTAMLGALGYSEIKT